MASTRARLLAPSLLTASLLALAPAQAQDWHGQLESEGGITEQEWSESMAGASVFGAWDEDGDGYLSQDEFRTGAYDVFDENDDGMIDEDEFARMEENSLWIISQYPRTQQTPQ
jgi:hypothetical protein